MKRLLEKDPESSPVYRTWISLLNKEAADGYGHLSAAERVFWDVYLLDLEVYNGGFRQYFGNTEGEYADDLVGSVTAIGADETAARVEWFFRKVFPEGVPAEAGVQRDLALRVETHSDQFRVDEEALRSGIAKTTTRSSTGFRRTLASMAFLWKSASVRTHDYDPRSE